jgi:hypothetical protein
MLRTRPNRLQTGFSGTNILMTHLKKFHPLEHSKLPVKKGGNLKKVRDLDIHYKRVLID